LLGRVLDLLGFVLGIPLIAGHLLFSVWRVLAFAVEFDFRNIFEAVFDGFDWRFEQDR
jgi:hypothetical protein